MGSWIDKLKSRRNNHLIVYGLPFLSVVLLGPFLLRHFGEIRYKYRKVKQVPEEEMKKLGFKSSDKITLESEYEKVKEMDIESWQQVRGPRPWEESFEEQKE